MSWNARRYQKELKFERYPPGGRRTNTHHVPPNRPDGKTCQRQFTLDLDIVQHRAYHIIFRNAPTYQAACQILWEKFWKPPEQGERCEKEE